jgi:hypothetical protein
MPRNLPALITDLNKLEPGDILIFRSDPITGPTFDQKAIAFFQSLTQDKPHGFDYSTHAGLCIRNDHGLGVIAHVTDTDNPELIQYVQEPIEQYMEREKSVRPFIVFRPKKKFIAERIAELADKAQSHYQEPITWTYSSAAKAICGELQEQKSNEFGVDTQLDLAVQTQNDPRISLSTHCSKFVVEIIKQATHRFVFKHLQIDNDCSVKNLENALYVDEEQYEFLYHPGQHCPFELLQQQIQASLQQIKSRDDQPSQQKYIACQKVLAKTLAHLATRDDLTVLVKADYLIRALDGLLSVNTGYNLKKSGSHEKLVELASRVCFFKHEQHDSINNHGLGEMPLPVSASSANLGK